MSSRCLVTVTVCVRDIIISRNGASHRVTGSQCVRKFLYKIPRVKQIFLIDGDKFRMINVSVNIIFSTPHHSTL